jgi:hypothetical protein
MKAPDRDANQWRPGKLWSFWDMLEVYGKPFVGGLHGLRNAKEISTLDSSWLTPKNLHIWIEALAGELGRLGCRQTLKQLETVRFNFGTERAPSAQTYEPKTRASLFATQVNEVFSRLEHEIEDQKLYCISGRDAEYLGPVTAIFGESVAATFNDQIYDLEEAAKSLAFGRSTASVFHLMRAMEAAVRCIGTKLGARIDDKNGTGLAWGKIIANVKVPIEKMPEGNERDQWSEIASLLYHVKQAWRNSTMHPKQTYTLEEAEDVFSAVKTFLRRLAPMVAGGSPPA